MAILDPGVGGEKIPPFEQDFDFFRHGRDPLPDTSPMATQSIGTAKALADSMAPVELKSQKAALSLCCGAKLER
jgi:hypothetical protein